nr:P10 protein [Ageratum virus 1]
MVEITGALIQRVPVVARGINAASCAMECRAQLGYRKFSALNHETVLRITRELLRKAGVPRSLCHFGSEVAAHLYFQPTILDVALAARPLEGF